LNDTIITVVGNLVADPELRFTPNGAAVANFRIASTPRRFNRQTSQWEDGEAMYLTCNVWRQAAEHVAESLAKGMRVIVQGKLRQRSYENKEGERRSVFEVEVDEVGPSLSFATAQVTRSSSNNNGGGYSNGGDGWGNAAPAPQNQWQNQQPQGGFQGGFGGGGFQGQGTPAAPNQWQNQQPQGGFGQPPMQQQAGDPWDSGYVPQAAPAQPQQSPAAAAPPQQAPTPAPESSQPTLPEAEPTGQPAAPPRRAATPRPPVPQTNQNAFPTETPAAGFGEEAPF
jgi:hypothetical protein